MSYVLQQEKNRGGAASLNRRVTRSVITLSLVIGIFIISICTTILTMAATARREIVNSDFEYPSGSTLASTYSLVKGTPQDSYIDPSGKKFIMPYGATNPDKPQRWINLPGAFSADDFGWSSTQPALSASTNGWITDVPAGTVQISSDYHTGNRFAELAIHSDGSSLYQDVITEPDTIYQWQLKHTSADTTTFGNDFMQVKIGRPGSETVQTATRLTSNGQGDKVGETMKNISTTNKNGKGSKTNDSAMGSVPANANTLAFLDYDFANAWETYGGRYVVPSGQTTTRFTFYNVHSPSPTNGNYLDDITFQIARPLTYDANGGTGGGVDPKANNYAGYYGSGRHVTLSTNKPTRSGYTFMGWSKTKTNPATNATTYAANKKLVITTLTMPAEKETVYAVWAKNPTLTFNANGGPSNVPASQTVAYGDTTTKPTGSWADGSTTIRTGYVMTGWDTTAAGGTDFNFGTGLTQDTTVYAQWRAAAYKVRFNKNATDATGTMADQQMQFDVAGNLTKNAFKRPGYTFLGWTAQSGGGGASYTDGQSVKNLSSTDGAIVNLYAKWQANGGSISIDKTPHLNDANGNGKADLGETISYSFRVTNGSKDVALRNVTVHDALLGEDIAVGDLAAGASKDVSATKTHTVTTAEALSGKVDNTAAVTGTPANGSGNVTDTDTATVTTNAPAASISVKKEAILEDANGNGKADHGEQLAWKVTVENTGNVDLTNVILDDALVGISGKVITPSLKIGGTYTFTTDKAPVTIAQAKAGSIENVAKVTATPPSGMDKITGEGRKSVNTVIPTTGITVKKTANLADSDKDGKADLGETVTYTLLVTNTGNTDLTDVTVTDPMFGNQPIKTIASLKAGTSETVTTSAHTVTVDEAKAGTLKNTATATGTPPEGLDKPTGSDTANVTTDIPTPKMTATKVAKVRGHETDTAYKAVVGDVIEYTITVHNAGNVPLTNVKVADAMLGLDGIIKDSLAPGADASVTGTYTVTQKDVDTGNVANTATVSATPPDGTGNVPDEHPHTDTPTDKTPGISVTKTAKIDDADGDGKADAGETVIWSGIVKNTGNVTLNDVTVTDDLTGLTGNKAITVGTLAPGDSRSVSLGKTTITAEQAKTGKLTNTAHAEGTPTGMDKIGGDGSSTVTTEPPAPAFEVKKSYMFAQGSDKDGDGKAEPGDVIEYAVTVKNTGNVTLTSVTVDDELLGWKGKEITGDIQPGASKDIKGTYTVKTSDMRNGTVVNTATGHAVPKIPGIEPPADRQDRVEVPTNARNGLLTKKTVDRQEVDPAKVGDVLTYTITVQNTGNTLVKDVSVSDPMVEAAIGSGNAKVVSAQVIDRDGNATDIVNEKRGEAQGTEPSGNANGTDTDANANADTNASANTHTADDGADKDNTQNQNENTEVGDDNASDTGTTDDGASDGKTGIIPSVSELQPDSKLVVTISYSITQEDIDAGRVENVATSKGTADDGKGTPVESTDQVVTTIRQTDGLAVEKTVDRQTLDGTKPGDTLKYGIKVTNTGNTTLTGISVQDSLTGKGLSDLTYSAINGGEAVASDDKADAIDTREADEEEATNDADETTDNGVGVQKKANVTFQDGGTLLPGQSVSVTATYAITADDIANGRVDNTAWATYRNADGTDGKSPESTVSTEVHATAEAMAAEAMAIPQTGDATMGIASGLGAVIAMVGTMAARRRTRR